MRGSVVTIPLPPSHVVAEHSFRQQRQAGAGGAMLLYSHYCHDHFSVAHLHDSLNAQL